MTTPSWNEPYGGYPQSHGPPQAYGHPQQPPQPQPGQQYGPSHPGMAQPVSPHGVPLAGFGARAGAYLIDSLIQMVLVFVVIVVVILGSTGLAYVVDPAGFDDEMPPLVMAGLILAYPAGFFAMFCYRWVPHSSSGQTIGKRVIGARVVRMDTGLPPSRAAAAGRELSLIGLSLVTCGVGGWLDLLWPLWDQPYQQSLHDKAAKTVVVQA